MDKIKIEIDNTYESCIKDGKWKAPGKELYEKIMKLGNESKIKSLINEVWLSYDKIHIPCDEERYYNSFTSADCKYPHHVLKGDKLVLSIPGVRAAYMRACQTGAIKNKSIKDHLKRHFKQLNLENDKLFSESIIEDNMNHLMKFLGVSLSNKNDNTQFNCNDVEESLDTIEQIAYNEAPDIIPFGSGNESVEKDTNGVIEYPDIMYFASPNKLQKLNKKVFLTPYIGLASIFCIEKGVMFEKIEKAATKTNTWDWWKYRNINIEYDEWTESVDKLQKPLDHVNCTHNFSEWAVGHPIEGSSFGYIYKIDVSKVKDKLHKFEKSPTPDNREYIYIGDEPLSIIEIIPHKIHWSISYDPENEERHGKPQFDFALDLKYHHESVNDDLDFTIDINKYLSESTSDKYSKPFDEVKSPEELLKWMNPIQYGWIDTFGKSHYDANGYDMDKKYKLQSGEEVAKNKIGICWDQCMLEKLWFDQTIGCKIYFIDIYSDKFYHQSHSFVVYQENGKYNWFEHSWNKFRGIHKYPSFDKLIEDVKKKFLDYYKKEDKIDEFNHIFISEITNIKPGLSATEYMKYAFKQKPIYHEGNVNIAKNNMTESLDLNSIYLEEDNNGTITDETTVKNEVEPKESFPKKIDKAESNKNGVRRKELYIAFIEWAKAYDNKNTFFSIFDKDYFEVSHSYVPHELRYFYRLASPSRCILQGNLQLYSPEKLLALNQKYRNSNLNKLFIFADTPNDLRIFNNDDKKVYIGIIKSNKLMLQNVKSLSFDYWIQSMLGQGDYLSK